MKYFVKYLLKAEYTLGNKLSIRAGEEKEIPKEVFDYLNSTYGDSGWFTFRKSQAPKKVVSKEKEDTNDEVKVETLKSTKKTKTVK